MPEVLGELLVQGGLEHVLREQLQQTIGASQRESLFLGQAHEFSRSCSLRGSIFIQ